MQLWDHQVQPRKTRRLWMELCWINTYKVSHRIQCIFLSIFIFSLTNEKENEMIRRLWDDGKESLIIHVSAKNSGLFLTYGTIVIMTNFLTWTPRAKVAWRYTIGFQVFIGRKIIANFVTKIMNELLIPSRKGGRGGGGMKPDWKSFVHKLRFDWIK